MTPEQNGPSFSSRWDAMRAPKSATTVGVAAADTVMF